MSLPPIQGTQILISLATETPSPVKMSRLKRMKRCVDAIENEDKKAPAAWDKIKKEQNRLMAKKTLTNEDKHVMKLMESIVEKYAQMDPEGVDQSASRKSELEGING